MTYEGWANYQTWDAALWLNNEYALYQMMVSYVQAHDVPDYDHFIKSIDRDDVAKWTNPEINRSEMNDMLMELKQELEMYG